MNNIISKNSYGFLDPFFDELFSEKGFSLNDVMRTDIKDEEDHYELKIEVPEIKKENLKLSLDDGYLTINASFNSNNNDENKNGKYIHRERKYGSFSRSFYVGKALKEEDIKAKLNDGVLTLVVPKEEAIKKNEEKKYINID